MKYFEIVTITATQEFTEWEGFDFATALREKEKALDYFGRGLTEHDRKDRSIECRVYTIPEDTDLSDKMEIADAICNCAGYDIF